MILQEWGNLEGIMITDISDNWIMFQVQEE